MLVLVWRGEVLGTRLAFGLTAGAVALGLANYIYGRVVLLAGGAFPTSTGILWSLAILFVAATIYEPRRNAGAGQDSIESPTYNSESARVRTFSIVVAILIASLSASMLAFRRGRARCSAWRWRLRRAVGDARRTRAVHAPAHHDGARARRDRRARDRVAARAARGRCARRSSPKRTG